MTVAVNFSELMTAFEFASVAGPFDNRAYVDLITGKIYLVSDELELEEELPDDLEESDRYLAVPARTNCISAVDSSSGSFRSDYLPMPTTSRRSSGARALTAA